MEWIRLFALVVAIQSCSGHPFQIIAARYVDETEQNLVVSKKFLTLDDELSVS